MELTTFPCIDEQTVEANWIPAPNPTTLKRVEMASPFAKRSLRLPSFAKEEYIGSLVALAATTAIPLLTKKAEKEKLNVEASKEDYFKLEKEQCTSLVMDQKRAEGGGKVISPQQVPLEYSFGY